MHKESLNFQSSQSLAAQRVEHSLVSDHRIMEWAVLGGTSKPIQSCHGQRLLPLSQLAPSLVQAGLEDWAGAAAGLPGALPSSSVSYPQLGTAAGWKFL